MSPPTNPLTQQTLLPPPLPSLSPETLTIVPPIHSLLAPLTLDTLDAKHFQHQATIVKLRIGKLKQAIAQLPDAEKSLEELRQEVEEAERRVGKMREVLGALVDSGKAQGEGTGQ
ncbi:hypothetical protein BJ508DRAFT_419114 [Ascobolus immersus RN42]|uniref:Mediator of RNA polymerase II transcription subunit 9 n=1 Tax=Ascobolus immersus RN42 TaxID=1160509 RepID=A0A3N4HGQ4_ASCIM|nr:hypothetical protein BJ508DRAFT_419114 [Ascobolus immersus RN42]